MFTISHTIYLPIKKKKKYELPIQSEKNPLFVLGDKLRPAYFTKI